MAERLIDANKLPVKQICIGGPMQPRWISVVYADDIDAAPTITPESLVRQEQQRSGCGFCTTAYDDWSDGFHEKGSMLFYFDHVFGWEGIGVKFCPMCGRELDAKE